AGGRGGDVARAGRRRPGKLASIDRGRLHAARTPADPGRGADARRVATRGGTTRSVTEEPNTKRILLVCTGNICRSPLAAALLDRALVERAIEGIAVTSAGTGAWDGAPVSEGAYLGDRRTIPGPGAGRGDCDSLDRALHQGTIEQRRRERAAADVSGANEQDAFRVRFLGHGASRPAARRNSPSVSAPSRISR